MMLIPVHLCGVGFLMLVILVVSAWISRVGLLYSKMVLFAHIRLLSLKPLICCQFMVSCRFLRKPSVTEPRCRCRSLVRHLAYNQNQVSLSLSILYQRKLHFGLAFKALLQGASADFSPHTLLLPFSNPNSLGEVLRLFFLKILYISDHAIAKT